MLPEGKYEFWWLMTTGELPCPNLWANKDSRGYVIVTTLRRHRVCESEHRIVMEEFLCRKLHRKEDVHHINGDRADNRRENLLLCNRKEHTTLHPSRRLPRTPETIEKIKNSWKSRPENKEKLIERNKARTGCHYKTRVTI